MNIIFIHLPRTGGTFLSEYDNAYWQYYGHHPASSLDPNILKTNYIIGNIRNPWDWYVSRYCYF